jgi:hypothetical protein
VIGIAEHGFHGDAARLQFAFSHAVAGLKAKFPGKPLVWVHPGLYFRKRGLPLASDDCYRGMLEYAQQSGVLLERNVSYGLLSDELLPVVDNTLLVTGADAHTFHDLRVWQQAIGASPQPAVPLSRPAAGSFAVP